MKSSIRFTLLLVTAAGITLAGCLKDKLYDDGVIQSVRSQGAQKIIELSTAPHDTTGFLSRAYPLTGVDTTVELVPVTLASASPAPEDINVTLGYDQGILDAYNDSFATEFVLPDPSLYSILNADTVVTIKKGTNVGYLMAKFIPNDLISDDSYAIPVVIKKVDKPGYIISGNLGKAIAAIGPKNKYDGLYSMRFLTSGWSAYAVSDNTPLTWISLNGKSIGMVTSGAASVKIFDYAYSNQFAQVGFTDDNVSPTYFGGTAPQLTFDLNTDELLSVNNTNPDPGRGRAFQMIPNDPSNGIYSHYDATTHIIYAAYQLIQSGRPPMNIYDTLTYKGDR